MRAGLIGAMLTAAVALGAASARADVDREAQWSFAVQRQGGSVAPIATFRDWTFRHIVFTAACDRRRHELVLTYFGDGATPLKAADRLEIVAGPIFTLKTHLVGGRLVGDLPLTPRTRAALTRLGDLEFVAPNEMGEPWYVGEAKAFKRVVAGCA